MIHRASVKHPALELILMLPDDGVSNAIIYRSVQFLHRMA